MDPAASDGPTGGDAADLNQAATWRHMWGYVRPHRRVLLVGGVLSLMTGATGLALPLAVRWMIDNFATGRPIGGLLVLMALLVVANAGIGAVGSYVLQRTAESVVLTARQRLTSRLLRLRLTAVEQTQPGDLMARVTSDTTLLRQVTTQSLVAVITAGLTFAATVLLMGFLDVVLLGVTLAVLAVAGTVIGLVVPRINQAATQAQESVGDIGSALERALGAFRTIKASGAEEREEASLYRAAESAWRAQVRAAVWNAVAGNTAGLASQFAFIVVLAVGGARVATGTIAVSTLVAFLLYVFYLMAPVTELAGAVGQYQVGKAAVGRIQTVERMPVETHRSTVPVTSREPAGVSFEDVHFRYGPQLPWVHHGVTFDAPPLGMTAFVGPSGAGKTTVFSLIERFYEAERGRVSVDGRDVDDWPLAELRSAIGYVEQDAPVLSGTVRENLLFGAPHASEEDIEKVLADARLSGLVSRLPEGLDTMVGHRGFKLSGGERQRVAIGRALLRGPRLLLLDEVTSQLDAVNEAALRDTVANAARATTVLVVAHRLSTVMMADRIVVMDAGRVRAVGTHAELVAVDPLYGELAATQFLASAT